MPSWSCWKHQGDPCTSPFDSLGCEIISRRSSIAERSLNGILLQRDLANQLLFTQEEYCDLP
jgi:hypothetical protein